MMKADTYANRKIFDIRADKYNNLEWIFDADFIQQILAFAQTKNNDQVLDLGAGTGAVSKALHGKVRFVCAIDLSEKMLAQAKLLLGNANDILLVIGDGQNICCPSESFDLIICRNAFHHFSNPIDGLHECYRVLKSEGVFLLVEPVAPNKFSKRLWSKIFYIRDKGRHPSFYFTTPELISFIKDYQFHIETFKVSAVPMSISNWLETGCVSNNEQREILRLFDRSSQKMREALSLRKEAGEWIIEHKWAILKLRKEIPYETKTGKS